MLVLHKRNLLKVGEDMQAKLLRVLCMGSSIENFKTDSHTSKGVLHYVYSDVWGPVSNSSHNGAQYFVNFINSRKVWIYFMKHKFDVFGLFKKCKAQVRIKLAEK